MRIIGGRFKNRFLSTPKQGTRPTQGALRECLFNICQGYIEDAAILDLFAGSGAIGLEALSRGAAHAVFIEKGKEAVRCIKQNIVLLGVEAATKVYPCTIEKGLALLTQSDQQFDLIYADPPYGEGWGSIIVQAIDSSNLLKEGGYLFIEEQAGVLTHLPPTQHLSLVSERKIGRSSLACFLRLVPMTNQPNESC